MNEIFLFTDGSVNTKSKIGYGAYLIVTDFNISIENLKPLVKVKRFEPTTSTKLELQTLLWALNDITTESKKIIAYTDSQNILGLQNRRAGFERNNYLSRQKRLLKNHELYKQFFKITDTRNCQFTKVPGHMVSRNKSDIDKIFTLVDRASRNALREYSK
jgi:ribonuclease HI